jgi:mannose-6-phosphate isomerase class I
MRIFPNVVGKLPDAGLGIEGLRIYICHADTREVWFLETDVDIDYPSHAHLTQWGIVLEGAMQFILDGQTQILHKGDRYFIPEETEHSVKMSAGYGEVIFLNEPNFLSR